MTLDFSNRGEVNISMVDYPQKILDEFPEEIWTTATSPAGNHLSQVREGDDDRSLPEDQAVIFHHLVAMLLFMAPRARRDIQTAVAFLMTQVKCPDRDDWGKLQRVMRYLKGTKHLKLTLSVDNLSIVKWWIDASYLTHDDCRGHTGAMMSLGKGAIISFLKKQKLNMKNSFFTTLE